MILTGKQIRARRRALNLTQKELGDALGVTGNTVARWERDAVETAPFLHLALRMIELESQMKAADARRRDLLERFNGDPQIKGR